MYFLEGNQGVGKSTFLKLLNKHLPQIEIQLEPLENWQKKLWKVIFQKSIMEK